jgi:hypothetical protein
MTKATFFLALAMQFSVITVIVQADDDTNIITEVTGRFQASKPAVVMSYDVTYAFLHIRLKRVASATIKATEGFWRNSPSNELIQACLIDFEVASPRTGDDISLFKRTVSVLSMPDLRIITYAKQNDEFIKPFLRKGRHMKYLEIYNFESGSLAYQHRDLISGTVETNLPGMADLARQSTEVADVLETLYIAYQEKPVAIHSIISNIHFNVEGAVRTFSLRMTKGRTSVPVLSRKLPALYADIQPEKIGEDGNESFSMWCVPFGEFSKETADPKLKEFGETSLAYSMLPLSGEYGLFLGAIQCTLTNICVQPLK